MSPDASYAGAPVGEAVIWLFVLYEVLGCDELQIEGPPAPDASQYRA
jgi:hypothetical protein